MFAGKGLTGRRRAVLIQVIFGMIVDFYYCQPVKIFLLAELMTKLQVNRFLRIRALKKGADNLLEFS